MAKPEQLIIDMRCRIPVGTAASYYQTKQHGNATAAVVSNPENAFFNELASAGIRTAVCAEGNNLGMKLGHKTLPPRTTSNDEQARLQKKHPGRFIGVAAIDPGNSIHSAQHELERCVKVLGLHVTTIEPGRAPLFVPHPADKRLYAFYDQAQALGVPVILQTSGMLGGKNIDYANPRWIDQVAEDFPDLILICAHGCYPYVREMIAVLCRRKNVYAAPDMYLYWPGGHDWLEGVNRERIANNFLFGSAYPLCGNLGKTLKCFLDLDWNPAAIDRILFRNALRALKLEDHPDYRELSEKSLASSLRYPLRRRIRRSVSRLLKGWNPY